NWRHRRTAWLLQFRQWTPCLRSVFGASVFPEWSYRSTENRADWESVRWTAEAARANAAGWEAHESRKWLHAAISQKRLRLPTAGGGAICRHFILHNSSFILAAQRPCR